MLSQVLKIVSEGGIHSLQDLAHRLGVTDPLLESMLEDLERLGYLRRVNATCTGRCQSCEAQSVCAISAGRQVWSLTETGLRKAGLEVQSQNEND